MAEAPRAGAAATPSRPTFIDPYYPQVRNSGAFEDGAGAFTITEQKSLPPAMTV